MTTPPFPSPVATWHNDTYSKISPNRPELSVNGKTVVVTGAGTGIGRETALSFAQAGAARLVLLGRNANTLEQTKAYLKPTNTLVDLYTADISQETEVQRCAKNIGQWDVMILNAGFMSQPNSIAQSSPTDWWQSFETNVKGSFVAVQALLPTANPSSATILGVTTGGTFVPPSMLPNMSSYISSKLAMIKFLEFVAEENPNIFVASMHPGTIDTATYDKSGRVPMPLDKVQLPAHFLLWLASSEAKFCRGRTVWSNWDVDELKAKAKEIESGIMLTSGVHGWPFV